METRIGRMLDMLLRVRAMLARPEFARLASSPAIAILGTTIGELQAYDRQQDVSARSSRGETARQRMLRQALLVRLRTLSAAARLQLPESPELVKFSMPSSRSPIGRLLGAAGGMCLAAAVHEDTLIGGGLEPGFIEDLTAAASAVRESMTERDVYRGSRREATAAIGIIAKRIRQLVLVLDGRVKLLVGDDAGLLAEWKQASRIGKKPGAAHARHAAAAIAEAESVDGQAVDDQAVDDQAVDAPRAAPAASVPDSRRQSPSQPPRADRRARLTPWLSESLDRILRRRGVGPWRQSSGKGPNGKWSS